MSRTLGLNRRNFLKASGLAWAAGCPLLYARNTGAQTGGFKRLLVLSTFNGTIPDEWFPESTGPLGTLPRLLAPFEPFKDKLVVFKNMTNLSNPDGSHPIGDLSVWNGSPPDGRRATSASIDQFVAQQVGGATPFPVLNFGVQVNALSAHAAEGGVRVHAMADPIAAFERVFGNYQPSGGDPAQAERLADRRSVLDLVGREFASITPQLGGENRARVEAHLTAVRELERRLSVEGPSGCQLPDVHASLRAGGWDGVGEFEPGRFTEDGRDIVDHAEQHPMIGRAHMDMLFEAFRCDLTRVATLQWSNSSTYGIQAMPWLDPPVNQGNHDLSHDFRVKPEQFDPYFRQRLWYSEQIAYLLNRLDNEIDFDGNTMLDNTIVLHGSDCGDGARHRVDSVPFLVVGSGGGHFKTGYTLDAGGRSQNDLLLSVSQAFGIDASTFGERDFNTGPIDALR